MKVEVFNIEYDIDGEDIEANEYEFLSNGKSIKI